MKIGAVLICSALKKTATSLAVAKVKLVKNQNDLDGPLKDVVNVRSFLLSKGVEISRIFVDPADATKSRVLAEITKCCQKYDYVILYYSGHGRFISGDWCFINNNKEEFITLEELRTILYSFSKAMCMLIVSDCCYSGQWVERAASVDGLHVQAACGCEVCFDSPEGGLFTSFWLSIVNNKVKRPSWLTGTFDFELVVRVAKFCANLACHPKLLADSSFLSKEMGIEFTTSMSDLMLCENKEKVKWFLDTFNNCLEKN